MRHHPPETSCPGSGAWLSLPQSPHTRGQEHQSRLSILTVSTAVRAVENANVRMPWGEAEIFQQRGEELLRSLFLTRENAWAFQRCRFGEQKKKADSSIPLGISLAFPCWPRYARSDPHPPSGAHCGIIFQF